jgi:hypothetical protein
MGKLVVGLVNVDVDPRLGYIINIRTQQITLVQPNIMS